MSLDNVKTGNVLTDWYIDRIADSSTVKPGELKATPGFWEGVIGNALGLNTQAVANQRQRGVNNAEAVNYMQGLGYDFSDLGITDTGGLTKAGVTSAISRKNKNDELERIRLLRGFSTEDTKTANAHAMDVLRLQEQGADRRANTQLQANRDSLTAQLTANRDQFAFTSKENNLNRRHERELADGRNDLNLQMKIMESELADKRMQYDRETARLDRRDRAIAQLMQGIGQLGGAFAL